MQLAGTLNGPNESEFASGDALPDRIEGAVNGSGSGGGEEGDDPASATGDQGNMQARFAPGDRVRVLRRFPPGHVRTPWYCRGKSGEVERICGQFRNPEQLAYGNRGAEHQVLYRVVFASRVLWPDYEGSNRDRVEIEIYEHWLAPEPGDAG